MRRRHVDWALSAALGSGWALSAALGCGGSPPADSGEPVRIFDYTLSITSSPKVLLVLVVDDRAVPEAEALRRGITDATRRLARSYVNADPAFQALWHPVDLRVIVVGASSSSRPPTTPLIDTDAPLAWTTVQATNDGADALAEAVGARALALTAPPTAPFQPLARARELVGLLAQERGPEDDDESRVFAVASGGRWQLALSIVVAADDASPEPPGAYALPEAVLAQLNVGLVTPASCARGPVGAKVDGDAERWPRLAAWSDSPLASVLSCTEGTDRAFDLLPPRSSGRQPRCDGAPIRQTAPGLGACEITITTAESECVAARGWADPKGADGVRRPRTVEGGVRACEALPVDSASLDTCVLDPSCPGCGSGWCVAQTSESGCPEGQMPPPIRWVGGVLPDPGTVHVVCLEANDSR